MAYEIWLVITLHVNIVPGQGDTKLLVLAVTASVMSQSGYSLCFFQTVVCHSFGLPVVGQKVCFSLVLRYHPLTRKMVSSNFLGSIYMLRRLV